MRRLQVTPETANPVSWQAGFPSQKLVFVIVCLCFMGWMGMVVGPMVSSVIMVVHVLVSTMGMLVGMFMLVLMAMGMVVFVSVDFIPMPMFVGVHMGVLVGMTVLVFMGAFHIKPSFVQLQVHSYGEKVRDLCKTPSDSFLCAF